MSHAEIVQNIIAVIGAVFILFIFSYCGYLNGYQKGFLKGRRMRGVPQVPKAKNPPPPPPTKEEIQKLKDDFKRSVKFDT